MDLVKKNLVSIICGVVILVSAGVLYFVVNGMYAEVQAEAEGSKKLKSDIQAIMTKTRTMPIVSIEHPEAQPLPVFPTKSITEAAKAALDGLKAESQAMMDKVLSMNKHSLLVPGSLPQPTSVIQFQFRDQYGRSTNVEDFSPDGRKWSMPLRIMQAGLAPTVKEIEERRLEIDRDAKGQYQYGPNNTVTNQKQVDALAALKKLLAPNDLRSKRSKDIKVYVATDTFVRYPGIVGVDRAPIPESIFYAQIHYWIQEEVAKAVAEANTGSKDVTESIVKRVVSIKIDPIPWVPTITATGAGGAPAEGAAPAAAGDPGTPNPALGLTGRGSNSMYDVAQFTIKLDVDEVRLPELLLALSRNRLVTVLDMSIVPVDLNALLTANYVYGTHGVVQITCKCEMLFFRDWLRPLMPPSVIKQLGVTVPPPA